MSFTDDLVSPLRVVSVLDPAIDRQATSLDEYAVTRDPALLRTLPGKAPRWATVRALSFEEMLGIDSAPSPAAKVALAFRAAVTSVEGPNGGAVRPTQVVPQRGGPDRATWSAEDLDALMREGGYEFVLEIGAVAYERAVQGKAWGGGASYTLPLSSVLGLQRIARRLAALESVTSGTRSSAESATESAATPPNSDAATDAAATATTEEAAATP